MKMCFQPYRPQAKNRQLIDACNAILTTFAEKGFVLSLRQLFYQLIVRGKIQNTQADYDNVGDVCRDGRYGGLIDWEHMTDRVRLLQDAARWIDAKDRLAHAAKTLRIDTWKGQAFRPEVWIEKDALSELADAACTPYDVPYIAIKAYNSASAMWDAYKRFVRYIAEGQIPLILHLGDFDYTGDDCSRFLQEQMLMMLKDVEGKISFRRLALNPTQIDRYDLPPQPGKMGDPRFKAHIKKHEPWLRKFASKHKELVAPMIAEMRKDKGKRENDDIAFVWELDALAPEVIIEIIEDGITDFMDSDLRGQYVDRQTEYRNVIADMSENYDALATDHCNAWVTLRNGSWGIPQHSVPTLPGVSPRREKWGIPQLQEMDANIAEQYYEILPPPVEMPISLTTGESQ